MTERYEIRGAIAEGGLGSVFRAWDRSLNREVAVKRVRAAEGIDAQRATESLLREAGVLSTIQHSNIVTVYDAGEDARGAFVVMELVKGETLEDIIARGALTERDFEALATQSLGGLIAAHALDLVHLDLKPQNLMICWHESGRFQVKILDFGLAQLARHPTEQEEDEGGAIMGSIYFMSPEQFERAPVDQRTDLYALGCIYYYALTQQYPFQGESAPQVMVSHMHHKFVPLAQLRPDLSAELTRWVEQLFARLPAMRPVSASEALDSLPSRRHSVDPGVVTASAGDDDDDEPVSATVVHRGEPVAKPVSSAQLLAQATRPAPRPGFPRWASATLLLLLLGGALAYGAMQFLRHRAETKRQARFAQLVAAENPQGSEGDVQLLLERLESPVSSLAAAQVLGRLEGSDTIDTALIDHLDRTGSTEARVNLIKALGLRRTTAALPRITPLLHAEDDDIRTASWTAAGMITRAPQMSTLIDLTTTVSDEQGMKLAQQALVTATEDGDEHEARLASIVSVMRSGRSPPAHRAMLLRVIKEAGGGDAFPILTESVQSPDVEVRKAACLALTDWHDTRPVPALAARFLEEDDAACRLLILDAVATLVMQPGALPQSELFAIAKKMHAQTRDKKEQAASLVALSRVVDPAAAAYFAALAISDADHRAGHEAAAATIHAALKRVVQIKAEGMLPAVQSSYARTGTLTLVKDALANWTSDTDWAFWFVSFDMPGTYELAINQSSIAKNEGRYEIVLAAARFEMKTTRTHDHGAFRGFIVGKASIPAPGIYKLMLRPTIIPLNEQLFRVRSIEMRRVAD